jgi:hypothetical protein
MVLRTYIGLGKILKGNIYIYKTSAKENLGLYEWKEHKPWVDEKCSRPLDQRKEAKMQRLQDPYQSNTLMCAVQDVKLLRSIHLKEKSRTI